MEMRTPRLVAVDEDGTFLRDHVHYDEERFERVWARMQEGGCRFVVATGNQYYQVQDLFARHASEIGYVTENGSRVVAGTEELFCAAAPRQTVGQVVRLAHGMPGVSFVMSGRRAAYYERSCDPGFVEDMSLYSHRLYEVDDLAEVEDDVFMFSSWAPEGRSREVMEELSHALDGVMVPVGSGNGYFDVVMPGINKGTGLARLMEHWGIPPEEAVAFGDSDNDLEMLALVGRGYAMANAPADVRALADAVAPPCTEDGVLQVLEELFA